MTLLYSRYSQVPCHLWNTHSLQLWQKSLLAGSGPEQHPILLIGPRENQCYWSTVGTVDCPTAFHTLVLCPAVSIPFNITLHGFTKIIILISLFSQLGLVMGFFFPSNIFISFHQCYFRLRDYFRCWIINKHVIGSNLEIIYLDLHCLVHANRKMHFFFWLTHWLRLHQCT